MVLGRVAGKAAETSARLLWERAAKPRATSVADVPAGPDAITREWLESILCRDYPGVRIVSFRETGRSSGSSIRRRFAIEYDERGRNILVQQNGRRGGLPASVFAKMTSTFSTRMAHGVSQTMAAEACFFREIRRHLELEAPWGYHGAADLRTFRSIQLMEDLTATRGATFCTPASEISRQKAEDAMGVLAAIHAPFHCDSRLDTAYTALKTLPG